MEENRGMPPIFGFLGKVNLKRGKTLQKSIVLITANILFISFSSWMLMYLENKYSIKKLEAHAAQLDDIKYWIDAHGEANNNFESHVNGSYPGFSDEDWSALSTLYNSRCFKLDNFHTQNNLWNFWSSLDFCATVLTTIGYGSMSPRTTLGKYVCILYSIIGIPIMAMYLALYSNGICYACSFFIKVVCRSISLLVKEVYRVLPGSTASKTPRVRFGRLSQAVMTLAFVFGSLLAFICLWSKILNMTNPADSFVKCMYFYVITLTTVGLGDISMTEAMFTVLIRVLFVFCIGLTLVTAVFNAVRSVMAANSKIMGKASEKIKHKAADMVKEQGKNIMEQADKVNKAMINNRGPQFTPLTEDVDDISDCPGYADAVLMEETTLNNHGV